MSLVIPASVRSPVTLELDAVLAQVIGEPTGGGEQADGLEKRVFAEEMANVRPEDMRTSASSERA